MSTEAFRLSVWIPEILERENLNDDVVGESLDDGIVRDISFHLARLGYLTDGGDVPQDVAGLAQALRRFQAFYRLQIQDGSLGVETLKALLLPRCAIPDEYKYWTPAGFKVNAPCRWQRNPTFDLKYRFLPGTPGKFINAVRAAMRVWERILMDRQSLFLVRFVDADPPDVVIGWTSAVISGDHNLIGAYIAHANFPCDPGNLKFVHFDDDEHKWAPAKKPNRLNAEAVALHELGHILGLTHSSNPDLAMYPTFQNFSDVRFVGAEGRQALRTLYGFPP